MKCFYFKRELYSKHIYKDMIGLYKGNIARTHASEMLLYTVSVVMKQNTVLIHKSVHYWN